MVDVRQRPESPRRDDDYIEVKLLDRVDDEDFWATSPTASHRSPPCCGTPNSVRW